MRISRSVIIIILMIFMDHVYSETPVLTLKELFENSDFVGVIKVDHLITEGTKKFALANVTDVWKGPSLGQVKYRAYPTWDCDTSVAEEGQYLLIFLTREGDHFAMTNSGQGAFDLNQVSGMSKYGTAVYRLTVYSFLSEKQISKLSSFDIKEKQFAYLYLTLSQFKRLLTEGNIISGPTIRSSGPILGLSLRSSPAVGR